MRWIVEQGASVLPKSYNEKRQAENADIFSWSLDESDLERIRGITNQQKLVPMDPILKGPWKTLAEFYDDEE